MAKIKDILSVPIGELEENSGQIEGVPANPRLIRDENFRKMVKSIKDDPEMMELRPLLVFNNVIIGGNMRFKACKELGWTKIPVTKIPAGFPPEKLRAIAIKDNNQFGENDWDALANEWGDDPLDEWGVIQAQFTNYQPEFSPEFQRQNVTDEDIATTQRNEDSQYTGTAERNLIDVVCPECGGEFQINRPE